MLSEYLAGDLPPELKEKTFSEETNEPFIYHLNLVPRGRFRGVAEKFIVLLGSIYTMPFSCGLISNEGALRNFITSSGLNETSGRGEDVWGVGVMTGEMLTDGEGDGVSANTKTIGIKMPIIKIIIIFFAMFIKLLRRRFEFFVGVERAKKIVLDFR